MSNITSVSNFGVHSSILPVWESAHPVARVMQATAELVKTTVCVSGGAVVASVLCYAMPHIQRRSRELFDRNPGIDPQIWKMVQKLGGVDCLRGSEGEALLSESVDSGADSATIRFLLEQGAGASSLGGQYGRNRISAAIRGDRSDLVELLIANGANPNGEWENYPVTPLIEAVRLDRKKIVETLLKNCGADALACKDYYPTIEAVKAGSIEMLKVLMACGVQLTVVRHRTTPLAVAVSKRDKPMVQFLLGTRQELLLNIAGSNPFAIAMDLDEYDIADLLFQHGANPNRTGRNGNTPLVEAIVEEREERVKRLLDLYHVDVNAVTASGFRPLHIAIYRDNMELVQLLIDVYRAEVHDLVNSRDPVIFVALGQGHTAMATMLIEKYHVDVNACDADGVSVLFFAKGRGFPDIIPILIAAGADEAYAEELLQRKFLAHMWWIGGRSEISDGAGKQYAINLYGLTGPLVMRKLVDYFEQFSLQNPFVGDSVVLEALKQARCKECWSSKQMQAAGFLQHIDPEQPDIFMGGFNKHEISMVIFREKFYLYNRGAGRNLDHAIEMFHIHQEINVHLLLKEYDSLKSFNEMIGELKEDGIIEKIGGYPKSSQVVGNCCWVQGIGAVEILFRCLLGDQAGEARCEAFIQFCCYEQLRRCEASPNPDASLIQLVWQKVGDGIEPK